MSISVRTALIDDAEVIAAFNASMAWETERLELDPQTVAEGVRAALLDERKGLYFIAEIDGQIAGQLMVTFEWSDWRNGAIWWIQSVYVAEAFRRRGVFQTLYHHVRSEARNRGAVALRLYVERDNHNAQKTYQAMGMALTHYWVMEQPLDASAARDGR